ncbi:MAG: DNA oxidative demethylase AlkB [Gammaproteobacteria bacterium]
MTDLLSALATESRLALADGAVVLRGYASAIADSLVAEVTRLAQRAPFRHMSTPGGQRMSVAMTNCGALGWVSDRRGYRYVAEDPASGARWPPLPAVFAMLARDAAAAGGFAGFAPDACLVNRYVPGTKLTLHQDRDERDFAQPIVSVSLGLPAVFLFGGARRRDPTVKVPLAHGDVVVWGGAARRYHHGVLPVIDGSHPATGACRLNLTFRRAG